MCNTHTDSQTEMEAEVQLTVIQENVLYDEDDEDLNEVLDNCLDEAIASDLCEMKQQLMSYIQSVYKKAPKQATKGEQKKVDELYDMV